MLIVRPARPDDVDVLAAMIHELADYERDPDACTVTSQQLSGSLFGAAPMVFAHVAEQDDEVIGMAIWFVTFSTWEGDHGIWLEDFYVRESARGSGAGTALMSELARICQERGYPRIDWNVLDWNEPSIGYYHALGAEHLSEWLPYRLTGKALAALAEA